MGRREARASTARTPSSTRPPARMRTSTPRRSTLEARPRRASAATTRRGRTPSSARWSRRSRAIPPPPRRRFPWIAFEGRWGELQKAFFNGPTGPNLKSQWTQPIEWSQSWRDRSYAVPTGGVLGTGATDFFCTAVATGSRGLVRLLRDPGLTLARAGGAPRPGHLARDADDVASGCAAAARTAAQLGSDPGRRGPDVRRARRSCSSASGSCSSRSARHRAPAGSRPRWARARRHRHDGGIGGRTGAARRRDRDDADTARPGTRPGCDGLCAGRARRGRRVGPVRAYRIAFSRVRPLLGGLGFAVVVWIALN